MILLGIGSNLNSKIGDRFTNINRSISLLESKFIKILKQSSFYETPSYPNEKDPKFINVVIKVSTNLSIEDFIAALISTEEKLGRKRNLKNEPRTCDIDILDYKGKVNNYTFKNQIFNFPHKKLSFRNFVLYPLCEIEPNWKHPKSKEKVTSLIENLTEENRKSILKIQKN
jgi:2-amino-4-hydroxy-6-hydroxymethyldihydropteridine diphosphokinase